MQFSEVENRDDYYQFSERGVTVWDQAGKVVVYDRAEQKMATLENELFIVASYYIQKSALKEVKVVKLWPYGRILASVMYFLSIEYQVFFP